MEVSDKYKSNIIKEYKFWTLFINVKQVPHTGRCYIWWKDRTPHEGEGLSLADLPLEALVEFQQIFAEVTTMCGALGYSIDQYGPEFLLNTCYLANEGHIHHQHMHIHFIPRALHSFVVPKTDIQVVDPVWGANYERNYEELSPSDFALVLAIMKNAI